MKEAEYQINVKPLGNATWREAKTLCVNVKLMVDGKEKHFSGIITDKETQEGRY